MSFIRFLLLLTALHFLLLISGTSAQNYNQGLNTNMRLRRLLMDEGEKSEKEQLKEVDQQIDRIEKLLDGMNATTNVNPTTSVPPTVTTTVNAGHHFGLESFTPNQRIQAQTSSENLGTIITKAGELVRLAKQIQKRLRSRQTQSMINQQNQFQSPNSHITSQFNNLHITSPTVTSTLGGDGQQSPSQQLNALHHHTITSNSMEESTIIQQNMFNPTNLLSTSSSATSTFGGDIQQQQYQSPSSWNHGQLQSALGHSTSNLGNIEPNFVGTLPNSMEQVAQPDSQHQRTTSSNDNVLHSLQSMMRQGNEHLMHQKSLGFPIFPPHN